MTLVQTVTVGAGGAASIEFTNIPQTGQDLLLVLSARGASANTVVQTYFSIGTATYNARFLQGTGSSVASFVEGPASNTSYSGWMPGANATASTFGNMSIYMSNYTSSANKVFSIDNVSENNATSAYQELAAQSTNKTSAITTITLTTGGGNYAQYSTASLYTISTTGATGATVS